MTFPRQIVCLALILLGITWTAKIVSAWQRAPLAADIPSYKRVDWWVLSARCAQTSGALLVACPREAGTPYFPIEDVSPTDDRGHALIAGVVARFKSTPFTKTDLVRINLLINTLGIFLLALFLFRAGWPLASGLILAAGLYYVDRALWIAGPDVSASFLGEYLLVASAVVWAATYRQNAGWSWSREWVWGVTAWGALVLAFLLRQAIGLSGLGAVSVVLAWVLIRRPGARQARARDAAILAVLLVICLKATTLLLAARNQIWTVRPPMLVESHGFSHALYQGLGTEPNPWGIVYADDISGHNAVMKINSSAGYGTPAYFQEIRGLYARTVQQNPLTAAKIYGRKILKILRIDLWIVHIPVGWLALVAIVLAVVMPLPYRALTLLLIFFLAQGVLVLPEPRVLYPMSFGVIALLAMAAEAGARRWWENRRVRPPSTADAV